MYFPSAQETVENWYKVFEIKHEAFLTLLYSELQLAINDTKLNFIFTPTKIINTGLKLELPSIPALLVYLQYKGYSVTPTDYNRSILITLLLPVR